MTMNRREAIRNLTYSAALFGLPASVVSAETTALPNISLLDGDPETYWNRLREEQFLMPGKRAFLNTGSVGVAARPVVKVVCDYLEQSAGLHMDGLHDGDAYPRWGYETLDDHRTELAQFVGCAKDELAITHNATHPSGHGPWRLREAKGEVTVREVALPLPPESPEQLADVVVSAIGPGTRVLMFSGITSPTGLLMPIREICDAARAKGVITVVDGAHMTGQVPFRIDDMNCDYFAGSPHKWLFAPVGSGLLYIREERLDLHYPVIATAGWDDKSLKAGRFMRFGTNNRAIIEGFMAGLHFAEAIGAERIYKRVHELAKDTYSRARALPYTEMLTPADDGMYGSLVTFRLQLPEEKLAKLWRLCDERLIWTTGNPQLRLSTHIHTRRSDLDLFFETLSEAAA
jgi:isopenicillin-N epimerase